MQLVGRNVPCKQHCASGPQQHLICTDDVTAVRRTLQRWHIWNTIASSSSSNPKTSANWWIFLILYLRRRYAATVAANAATKSSMPVIHAWLSPSHRRSVFEGRFELLRPSVRGTPSYLWAQFLTFLITSSFDFSKFSDQLLLLRMRFLRKKCSENVLFYVP